MASAFIDRCPPEILPAFASTTRAFAVGLLISGPIEIAGCMAMGRSRVVERRLAPWQASER